MSDPLFASIRDEMLTQMLAEELVRGSADWSLAMSRIDAAEEAYLSLESRLAEEMVKGGDDCMEWSEANSELRTRVDELERIKLFALFVREEVAAANADIAEATKVDGEPNG